jgi:hypothetical protein
MRSASVAIVGLLFAYAAHTTGRAEIVAAPIRPAVWYHYDVIVDLQDLPKRYTCDDLWYKFRDILLTIGARPDMEIVPHRCPGPSPHVQIRFSFPHVLTGSQVRFASLQVVSGTVRLEAGHPRSLDVSDCALLQQIQDTLLAGLPVRVESGHLSCPASPASHRPFQLSVQTLQAASQKQA